MNLIVIPARGGSKRIPGKNLRPFAGKPIIAHSIAAALASRTAARVVVSTDSAEIAAFARSCGAEVPFIRPPELANDHAGTMPVIQHAIGALADADGFCPQNVCCLYATAPFVTPELIAEGLQRLEANPARAYVFTVTDFGFPVQRALRITGDGTLDAVWPEHRFTRSQDLEPFYQDAGQLYWGRRAAWEDGVPLYSPAAAPFVLPRHLVQDIDTLDDWRRAEWLYAAWKNAAQTTTATTDSSGEPS